MAVLLEELPRQPRRQEDARTSLPELSRGGASASPAGHTTELFRPDRQAIPVVCTTQQQEFSEPTDARQGESYHLQLLSTLSSSLNKLIDDMSLPLCSGSNIITNEAAFNLGTSLYG